MATFDLGRVTPIYRREYNASTSYELNDVVLYNGNLYWHVQATATVGILPTDATVWKLAFSDEGVRAEIRGYADDAQTSKTAAAQSASQASASASNASASASQAASSAQTAGTKASEASTSAQTASTKASEASASAQSAATSAQTATDEATLASQKAAAASESATLATAKANAAATSETNAAASAQTATTKSSEAAASATSAQEYDESAQQSAVNAQTSATNAATSATSAANAASAAQGVLDSIPEDYSGLSRDVDDLKADLMLEKRGSIEVTDASIIQGSYNSSGAPTSNSTRIRVAGFIPVYNGLKIRFTAGANAQQMLYGKFDANRTFVADGTWLNSGILDVDWDGYIILSYRKTNNADITPSEYDATTTLLSSERDNFDNINRNLSAVVYGVNKTFTVERSGYYSLQCLLIKGSTYTYTNNTSSGTNLLLLKSDGTTTTISSHVPTGKSLMFTVDGNDYVGIRFWANETGSISIKGGYALTNARDEIDTATVMHGIESRNGYINESGGISSPSATRMEIYTDKIPCDTGFEFSLSLTYASADSMWAAYAIYDESGTFIERPALDAGTSRLSNIYTVTITNTNARYIAFTFRTYGDCVSVIKSPQYTSILDVKIGDIDDRLSSVENATKMSATAVRSVNHRGYNTVAPENTLPAYKLSRKMGFDAAETDVSFTSDGVAVLLHDGTINRTARNADGTELSEPIDIGAITYEQVLQYDFGIWKSAEYAGTKIPTFTQFIQLCKRIGLSAYVELKPTGATEARVRGLVDIVKNCGMTDYVTWISFYPALLTYVKNYVSTARIGLVTETVNAETIQTANGLKTADNEVFINSDVYGSSVVALCASENIPLEVWTIDNQITMENLDAYITGATSNSLIFGRVLYNKYIN